MNIQQQIGTLAAGPDVVLAIKTAKEADVPIILQGPHGVGKSQLFVQAAEELGIELVRPNLAATDPTDFTGIPYIEAGRTFHAPSDMLPTSSKGGIFLLDEANRADLRQRSFLYQFLEERRLHGYALPAGWLPAAAINNNSDGYQVFGLDEAFLSRFLIITVSAPEAQVWVAWAGERSYHPVLLEFVMNCPEVFTPPSCPRNFSQANSVLQAYEKQELKNDRILLALLIGTLGERLGLAFYETYRHHKEAPLTGRAIVEGFASQSVIIKRWVAGGRLDIVHATLENLKRYLGTRLEIGKPGQQHHRISQQQWENIEQFLAVIPGDLQQRFLDWLKDQAVGAGTDLESL